MPFGGFLRAPWDFGLLTLLQKSFWYGSAVWLLRAAGWRLAHAAIAVAVLLGAIEERVLSSLSSTKVRTCDVELP